MDQLNVDAVLSQKFASFLETNADARLAVIVPMTGSNAAGAEA
jgi:hypothetical protein